MSFRMCPQCVGFQTGRFRKLMRIEPKSTRDPHRVQSEVNPSAVCPRSFNISYIVRYYITWVKSSGT